MVPRALRSTSSTCRRFWHVCGCVCMCVCVCACPCSRFMNFTYKTKKQKTERTMEKTHTDRHTHTHSKKRVCDFSLVYCFVLLDCLCVPLEEFVSSPLLSFCFIACYIDSHTLYSYTYTHPHPHTHTQNTLLTPPTLHQLRVALRCFFQNHIHPLTTRLNLLIPPQQHRFGIALKLQEAVHLVHAPLQTPFPYHARGDFFCVCLCICMCLCVCSCVWTGVCMSMRGRKRNLGCPLCVWVCVCVYNYIPACPASTSSSFPSSAK